MPSAEVIVVGGGIAGLSATWHLARAGIRVVLLERERLLASHASARNAAIFRHIERAPSHVALALRSATLFSELGLDAEPVQRIGALYVGAPTVLAEVAEAAARGSVPCSAVSGGELGALAPGLSGSGMAALHVPSDGVMDVHGVLDRLARSARACGARLCVDTEVQQVLTEGRRVTGVRLANGETLRTDTVVLAAGAWAAGLGEACGAPLPLVPHRRHLVMLAVDASFARGPIVWRLDPHHQVYFRPESGGVLASPCDEEAWPAGAPPADLDMVAQLGARLSPLAPAIARGAVRRAWACLRTLTPDGELAVGEDPRCDGLFWLAGLGGRGMTCGLALGELAAACVRGVPHPLARALAPARWVHHA